MACSSTIRDGHIEAVGRARQTPFRRQLMATDHAESFCTMDGSAHPLLGTNRTAIYSSGQLFGKIATLDPKTSPLAALEVRPTNVPTCRTRNAGQLDGGKNNAIRQIHSGDINPLLPGPPEGHTPTGSTTLAAKPISNTIPLVTNACSRHPATTTCNGAVLALTALSPITPPPSKATAATAAVRESTTPPDPPPISQNLPPTTPPP